MTNFKANFRLVLVNYSIKVIPIYKARAFTLICSRTFSVEFWTWCKFNWFWNISFSNFCNRQQNIIISSIIFSVVDFTCKILSSAIQNCAKKFVNFESESHVTECDILLLVLTQTPQNFNSIVEKTQIFVKKSVSD
jgi:hypothetical protein